MKFLLIFFLPFMIFGQKKDEWSIAMQTAMKDIQNQNFKTAIINLDKSLKIVPKNPSALYFKGYSQIIIGEKEQGCNSLIDALFYNSNSARDVFAEKCMDFNPKLNPENFKTGKFTLQVVGDSTVYNFERKNNMQYETYDGKIYSGKLLWYENGDYTIIPTEETKKTMTENPTFLTRILKIENNEYLYEKIENNQVQFGRIIKINE